MPIPDTFASRYQQFLNYCFGSGYRECPLICFNVPTISELLGSLCTFMCVHTFRGWASELGIMRLGPIPRLGPTGARNVLITFLPLATCYSMLNSHTKSIHYVHAYFRTSALVLCSLRLQPLAASSDGRLLEAFGLDSYR